MSESIERGESTSALVFAAGELPPPAVSEAVVRRRSDQDAFVVAADGGLVYARLLGIAPQLIVGDFDSVSAELLAAYPPHLIQRHAVAKDELDLELALAAAREAGAREVSVLGAFGKRFDQSLAALLIAARLTSEGVRIDLHGGRHSAWPLAAGMTIALELAVGTTVSVISLVGDAVVRGVGLTYPLSDRRIPFGTGLGVSNAVAGRAGEAGGAGGSITCVSGLIAVLAEY